MLEKSSTELSAILILVFIFSAISIADSITIPSDKNIPDVPKDLKDFVYSGPSGESKSVTYSSGSGAREKTQYIQVPENPIQITKSIIPLRENYHTGDTVAIFVEVKNMGTELKKIDIKEYVDKGLDIINISKNAYILKELDEIADYKSESNSCYYLDMYNYTHRSNNSIHADDLLDIKIDCGDYLFNQNNTESNHNNITKFINENFDINWSNITVDKSSDEKILRIMNDRDPSEEMSVTVDEESGYGKMQYNNKTYKFRINSHNIYKLSNEFDIYINKLDRKDRIVYWYYAKLKKIGDFDASTIFRYWVEENSHFLDVDKILTIGVVRPTLNVDVDINRLNLLKKEDAVNITYKITYMGPPMSNTVKLDFVKKSYYDEIQRYGPDVYVYPRDIHVGEPFTKTIKISYPNEGEYFSPEIIINGEIFPFTKEKIVVETRFGKYANLVALILAIVFFFIGDLSMKLNYLANSRDVSNYSNPKDFIRERSKKIERTCQGIIILFIILLIPIIYFTSSSFYWILVSLIICAVILIAISLYFKLVTSVLK